MGATGRRKLNKKNGTRLKRRWEGKKGLAVSAKAADEVRDFPRGILGNRGAPLHLGKGRGKKRVRVAPVHSRGRRLDPVRVDNMLEKGMSRTEVSKKIGVAPSAIHSHIKTNQKYMTQLVVGNRAGPLLTKKINAMDQVMVINQKANVLLNTAMEGLKTVEDHSYRIMRDPEQAIKVMEVLSGAKDTALRAMGEIRAQLKLQMEIYQAIYDLRAAEEFQKTVISVIGEMDPDARDRVLERLRKGRAVRQAAEQH